MGTYVYVVGMLTFAHVQTSSYHDTVQDTNEIEVIEEPPRVRVSATATSDEPHFRDLSVKSAEKNAPRCQLACVWDIIGRMC